MRWHAPVAAALLPLYAFCAPAPAEGGVRSVHELIRIAREQNLELAALRQRVDAARGVLRQAGVRPVPSVEFGASSARPFGAPGKEEYSAGYSQPVELGGKRARRVDTAESDVRLAAAEFELRAFQLATEIKLRYVDAITARKKLDLAERQIEAYAESLRLLDARVEQGDAARLDAELVRVESNRARAQRPVLAAEFEAALTELRRLCGLDASAPLTLAPQDDAPVAATLEQAQATAVERRGELRTARLIEARGAAELRLTEAQARPDITVSVGYALRNERFSDLAGLNPSGGVTPLRDRDSSLSAGVSIPLTSHRSNAGNIDAAVARATAARTLARQVRASIPLEVQAAWQRWQAALKSVEMFEGGVLRLSERNLDVMREAYTLGQLRMLDVLNEQRRLLETQMAYADAQAGARRARVALEAAVGGEIQ